ncbi:hypothetical protein [Magnetococcus sp. PR-3]|uniref:hypothetical protein n=1 Tax=Magnetococcus sp. PR-3 TaxID=3120355 RepID=UPI002FCDE51A
MALVTMPSSPLPSALVITQKSVTAVSESPFTLQRQTQIYAERWQMIMTIPVMRAAQARLWRVFLSQLSGKAHVFHCGITTETEPEGVGTGLPIVEGAEQVGFTLNTTGWNPSIAGILKAGDLIQVGQGSLTRLYQLTADAASNSNGQASLSIWPRLRESPSDGVALTIHACKGTFYLDSNEPRWEVLPGGRYKLDSLALVEAL